MHYTRNRAGKRYLRFAFLICAACYSRLSVAEQGLYSLCNREACGSDASSCERCADEASA